MNCAEVRHLVPGYLDDALPERLEIHARMARHLERCRACREELQRYVQLSKMMSGLRSAPTPDRLGVSIRVAVALARETQGFRARILRYKNRLRFGCREYPGTFGRSRHRRRASGAGGICDYVSDPGCGRAACRCHSRFANQLVSTRPARNTRWIPDVRA